MFLLKDSTHRMLICYDELVGHRFVANQTARVPHERGAYLVRTNALKMVCTAVLSGVALVVFVARGQVMWFPGLVLAVGMVIGTTASVRFAISVSQKTLKWLLLIMVSIASGAAMLS